MSPRHINNSLIMENNLQSSNLCGADFLHQMSPSTPPTTQGQDVTLLQADLHLNKYRPRRNNVQTQKRNRRLSFGHVQFVLPDPAKLQGTIRREGGGLPSWRRHTGLLPHSEKLTQRIYNRRMRGWNEIMAWRSKWSISEYSPCQDKNLSPISVMGLWRLFFWTSLYQYRSVYCKYSTFSSTKLATDIHYITFITCLFICTSSMSASVVN